MGIDKIKVQGHDYTFGEDSNSPVKVMTDTGTKGIVLVDTADPRATRVRTMTATGVKAWGLVGDLELSTRYPRFVSQESVTILFGSLSDLYNAAGAFYVDGATWVPLRFILKIPGGNPTSNYDSAQLVVDGTSAGGSINSFSIPYQGAGSNTTFSGEDAYISPASPFFPPDALSDIYPTQAQVSSFLTAQGEVVDTHLIAEWKERMKIDTDVYTDIVQADYYAEITARRGLEAPNAFALSGCTDYVFGTPPTAKFSIAVNWNSEFYPPSNGSLVWKDVEYVEVDASWNIPIDYCDSGGNLHSTSFISSTTAEIYQYGIGGWNTSSSGWSKIADTPYVRFKYEETYNYPDDTFGVDIPPTPPVVVTVKFRTVRMKDGTEYSDWTTRDASW